MILMFRVDKVNEYGTPLRTGVAYFPIFNAAVSYVETYATDRLNWKFEFKITEERWDSLPVPVIT